jgi:hypothetical protein
LAYTLYFYYFKYAQTRFNIGVARDQHLSRLYRSSISETNPGLRTPTTNDLGILSNNHLECSKYILTLATRTSIHALKVHPKPR